MQHRHGSKDRPANGPADQTPGAPQNCAPGPPAGIAPLPDGARIAQTASGARCAGIAIHHPPLTDFAKSKGTLGVGVQPACRGLSYPVDDAILGALGDGRIDAIFESHIDPERPGPVGRAPSHGATRSKPLV